MKTVALLAVFGLFLGCGINKAGSSESSNVMGTGSSTRLSSQTLTCAGRMNDDNGFFEGNTTLSVTIDNPDASTLKKLTRDQASRRIELAYPSSYSIDLTGAKIEDSDLLISAFTAREFTTVVIPVAALGKTGSVKGVSASFGSGGGTETADYTCRSSLK